MAVDWVTQHLQDTPPWGGDAGGVPPQVYTFFRRVNLAADTNDSNHSLTIVENDIDYSEGAEEFYTFDAGNPTYVTISEDGIYNIAVVAWATNTTDAVPQVQPRLDTSGDLSDTPSIALPEAGGYQVSISMTNYILAGTHFSLNATNADQFQYASFRVMKVG